MFNNNYSIWNIYGNNFTFSHQEFYNLLLKELQNSGIKDMSVQFVFIKNKKAVSKKDKYLRINWKNCEYDICVKSSKDGLLISWSLNTNYSFLERSINKIPKIGSWLITKTHSNMKNMLDLKDELEESTYRSIVKVVNTITHDLYY